jgi:hypothetical protein
MAHARQHPNLCPPSSFDRLPITRQFFKSDATKLTQMLSNMCSAVIIAVVVAVFSSTAAAAASFPPVWPYPAKFTNGSDSLFVDSVNFKFSSNVAQSDCTSFCPNTDTVNRY